MSAGVVYRFQKNKREHVCATVDTFKGMGVVSVRVFVVDDAGEMRATPKGLTLRVEQLPELRKAVDALIEEVAA